MIDKDNPHENKSYRMNSRLNAFRLISLSVYMMSFAPRIWFWTFIDLHSGSEEILTIKRHEYVTQYLQWEFIFKNWSVSVVHNFCFTVFLFATLWYKFHLKWIKKRLLVLSTTDETLISQSRINTSLCDGLIRSVNWKNYQLINYSSPLK